MSSLLTAPSQIAERQLAYFSGKKVLIAGEVEDDFPMVLEPHCEQVMVYTTHYGYYSKIAQHRSIECVFSEQLNVACEADLLLLYWPKAKQEALFLLTMLMAKLGQGTEIVVVGENRSGIRSIEKMFAPYGTIKKQDSARRCAFYWGECSLSPAPFVLEDWFKSYDIAIADENITVKTLPGVFSHGELDVGSRLLLDTLPKLSGNVLDFGCGAGVIGAVIAKKNPEVNLSLCDVSALAIASTNATLAANQITATAFASDVYSNINQQFDTIVSNPPFHSGLETHYDSTEQLLALAPNYLARGGLLCIVANSFLQYPPIIERHFGHCHIEAKTNKFAIYSAIKGEK
jgi:16S rRNA (guanine1207-N2)-methyltransferase